MPISQSQRRALFYITLLTLIWGVGGGVLLQHLTPGRYFGAYPFIPIFFYGYAILSLFALSHYKNRVPKRVTSLLMALKMFKFVLTILCIVVYALLVPQSAVVFMVVFAIFYLSYLIFESWFIWASESKEKKKQ